MELKHRLKRLLRTAYSRLIHHTPLWRLVDRLTPGRLVILVGHCVADEETNGDLPADMKISPERLTRLLEVLGRRFELVTVAQGLAALSRGARRGRVALTMDDGYRDNRRVLPGILERVDGRCTVFLETRPLEERRISWLHKYLWLCARLDSRTLADRYARLCEDPATFSRLRRLGNRGAGSVDGPGEARETSETGETGEAGEAGGAGGAELKRVLKYDAPPAERERVIDTLFREEGGDERALCERIYMTWDDARELFAHERFEVGGHTVGHPVLSRTDPEEAARQIAACREALVRELGEAAGHSFAYPYGRRWDFDPQHAWAARRSGFRAAVTTHAAANRAGTDPMGLGRWPIEEDTPLHELVTEAAGGFELLRRLGLDLVE